MTVANRREVVAVSGGAVAVGIRRGMTLAQAKALCAHVEWFEHDPVGDGKALCALGRYLMRFTPVVMPVGLSAVLLDVTGCERVFGGVDAIVRGVVGTMARLGISARVAGAPTVGAAWAMTFAPGGDGWVITEGEVGESLAGLPVWTLRVGDEVAGALNRLGVETVGQLTEIPRGTLPGRFGGELLRRLDQALGRIAEPVVGMAVAAPIEAREEFEFAVTSIEAVWVVFKHLIGKVVAEMGRRGVGARRVVLEFGRPYAAGVSKEIDLVRASRDAVELFKLCQCALETVETEVGYTAIGVRVARYERVAVEQIGLLEGEEFVGERELARLVERLCVRLGKEGVGRAELVEAWVPERGWKGVDGLAEARRRQTSACVQDGGVALRHRPLRLLGTPVEVSVMVSPSEDRDGRPILFVRDGERHVVKEAVGPERICGMWWEGRDKSRDYFDVEDEHGRRWWLFRVNETRRWFVHGAFE